MKSLLQCLHHPYPVGSKWHIRGYEYVYVITRNNAEGLWLQHTSMYNPTYWEMKNADKMLIKVII